jgi:hypothetical protein
MRFSPPKTMGRRQNRSVFPDDIIGDLKLAVGDPIRRSDKY